MAAAINGKTKVENVTFLAEQQYKVYKVISCMNIPKEAHRGSEVIPQIYYVLIDGYISLHRKIIL